MTRSEVEAAILAKAADDDGFRTRLLADPASTLKNELGLSIPEGYEVEVHEETGTTAHMVLPQSSRLSEAELTGVAGGSNDQWTDYSNW